MIASTCVHDLQKRYKLINTQWRHHANLRPNIPYHGKSKSPFQGLADVKIIDNI